MFQSLFRQFRSTQNRFIFNIIHFREHPEFPFVLQLISIERRRNAQDACRRVRPIRQFDIQLRNILQGAWLHVFKITASFNDKCSVRLLKRPLQTSCRDGFPSEMRKDDTFSEMRARQTVTIFSSGTKQDGIACVSADIRNAFAVFFFVEFIENTAWIADEMPMRVNAAQIVESRDRIACAQILHELFAHGGDETAIQFIVLAGVFINTVFLHVFAGGFEQIRADERPFVAFLQRKVQIAAEDARLMRKDGPSISGMAAVDDRRSRKVIMTITEFAAQSAKNIRKYTNSRHTFWIVSHRLPRQFLSGREGVFDAAHGLLRVEQHAGGHFMQYINQSFQPDNRFFINDFLVAFAENDGARMPPHHADDIHRFRHVPNRRQFRLHIDAQLVAGVVERFGRTPCVTTDEVESSLPQHAQIM